MGRPLLERLRHAVDPLDTVNLPGPGGHKAAAVLLLFDISHPDLPLLFLLRTNHLRHHPGQIALPGGMAEPADADLVATALRETAEEVGIPAANISVMGALPSLLTATSDRWLTPIVGFQETAPELRLDPFEVQESFYVTLRQLMNAPHTVKQLARDGIARDVHFYEVEDRIIWGVTGAIIFELLSRLDAADS